MAPSTSFVFVPGAWHGADTWQKVATEIEKDGHNCTAVTLPSTLSDPAATFEDDIKAVRDAIAAETTKGHDVVVVVHSYGGQVGNSAVKGFAKGKGVTTPESGHVIGLAMIATGFTVAGLSFLDGLGGKPPPQWIADTETGFATIVVDARDMLYHDLPENEGNLWVSKLTKQSLKALKEGGEHSYPGWQDVPCWYLSTLEDHGLPPLAQQFFVKTAQEAGADVTLREIQSSHSPMLSKPKETANFILESAKYFEKKQ